MTCRTCGAENSDGRETCLMCGQPLLDLTGIMERDRWAGFAVKGGVIGVFAGAAIGAVAGFALGILMGGPAPIESAIGLAWLGFWVGMPVGAMIGAGLGIMTAATRRNY